MGWTSITLHVTETEIKRGQWALDILPSARLALNLNITFESEATSVFKTCFVEFENKMPRS